VISLVKKKKDFPEENDLVICSVTKVFAHGAFAKLDEYQGKEGFIHISEVASTWIKNIRDFVREGQKTVAKVMKVNRAKGHIDMSIRRVAESQKKLKMQEWKRAQKAEKLLELVAKKIGKSLDDAYEKVGFPMEEEYGEIYAAMEDIAAYGEEILEELKIPAEWKEPLLTIVQENVTVPEVDIKGYLDLRCPTPDGIGAIKKALIKARDSIKEEDVELDIRYVGSPRYSIRVKAPDYKTAEEVLRKAADKAISIIQKDGGTGQFLREVKEEA
jgi:translation initiation factor 2 subunit 1